jgi:hypothetical protein
VPVEDTWNAGLPKRLVLTTPAGVNFQIKWFCRSFGAGLDAIVKLKSP